MDKMVSSEVGLLLADVRSDVRRLIAEVSEAFRYNDGGGVVGKLRAVDIKLRMISESFNAGDDNESR